MLLYISKQRIPWNGLVSLTFVGIWITNMNEEKPKDEWRGEHHQIMKYFDQTCQEEQFAIRVPQRLPDYSLP